MIGKVLLPKEFLSLIGIFLAVLRGPLPQVCLFPPERKHRMLLEEVLHKHFSHLLEGHGLQVETIGEGTPRSRRCALEARDSPSQPVGFGDIHAGTELLDIMQPCFDDLLTVQVGQFWPARREEQSSTPCARNSSSFQRSPLLLLQGGQFFLGLLELPLDGREDRVLGGYRSS